MALNADDNDHILETALLQAFSPPPSRHQSAVIQGPIYEDEISQGPSELPQGSAQEVTVLNESTSDGSSGSNDAWKQEYEAQVETWRTQSAIAREKAERERHRWEEIRAAEEATKKGKHSEEPEWESISEKPSQSHISATTSLVSHSPSPADVRDLVTGEKQKRADSIQHSNETPTRRDMSDSQKWEDVPSSIDSSFPSMSFPERPETPSPPVNSSGQQQSPYSATLSVFDSSLPTRTRVTAMLSSLAINLLLPFVNGVMLGFGEIFAKNVVLDWLGWKTVSSPGSVAANKGFRYQRTR